MPWNRALESPGNSVELQHVNLRVPDQTKATAFYISALGLTRDPYLVVGVDNMWANAGVSQFHLPTGPAQVLRGTTGLVLPDRAQLLHRLQAAKRWLDGTQYGFAEHADHVAITCPGQPHPRPCAGCRPLRPHQPRHALCRVRRGAGHRRRHRPVLPADRPGPGQPRGRRAKVLVAPGQYLTFRETDRSLPAYDGHHIQLAFVDFGGVHARLAERGLISQEDSQHQYRFIKLVDPDTASCCSRSSTSAAR